jgi:hypothetical protein
VLAGEQHLPKVLVLFGDLFDASKVASHFLFSLRLILDRAGFQPLQHNLC